MIYLLDTDILIFIILGLKSVRRPADKLRSTKLVDRCRHVQTTGHSVGLSAVTVSELEFGARKSGQYEAEIAAVEKVMMPFDVYDYDAVTCPPHYGQIRLDLEAKGATIGSMDLLIATHALALGATLVTNNLSHFSRVPALRTTSWLTRA